MTTTNESVFECEVRTMLARYWGEIAAKRVFFRGISGGFSGSRVWEVIPESSTGYFLKQWPPNGPDLRRLKLIHHVLSRLNDLKSTSGFDLPAFPSPVLNRAGNSISIQNGKLFDLTERLPGRPLSPDTVCSEDVRMAMQSIAKTHLALFLIGQKLSDQFTQIGRVAPSPGLKWRHQLAANLARSFVSIETAVNTSTLPSPIHAKCRQLLAVAMPALSRLLRDFSCVLEELAIQPCLRDLWYAHVLFDNSQVSGIIDFGSIGEDCVATDLARLLRSWFPANDHDFDSALDAYSTIRPLSQAERTAFRWFDRTSRVLSAFQWIEWLAVDRREFDDWETVSERLDFVLARLPS